MELKLKLTGGALPDQNRRMFFKAALGSSILPTDITHAASTKSPISWVHGNSATIADVIDLEMDKLQGSARVVQGRSWSVVPLHFAVPSIAKDSNKPMYVNAVWVRLKTDLGAKIVALALHDCETTIARVENIDLRQQEWGDVRINLNPPRKVMRSIGITLDCEFGDVARQIGISAVGCEFSY